ncbi:hypothetical protein FB451DRAFT_1052135, partial [Mycena latifolia]
QEVQSKPVTVNWRDIKATIHGKPQVLSPVEWTDSESETSPLRHHDPVKDGLSWLNDGLPDLRSSPTQHFDLAAEFDIARYLHVLADSIQEPGNPANGDTVVREPLQNNDGVNTKAAASTVAPKADEWGSWA